MAQAYADEVVEIMVLTKDASQSPVQGSDITMITVPAASAVPITAQICAEIHERNPQQPIVFVAEGDLAELLPNIAFAQRTAHRSVAGYVLIEPTLGPPALDWPDAPVLVLGANDADERVALLRGWQFRRATDPQALIRDVRTFASDVTPT
jgi:hypothetical protein